MDDALKIQKDLLWGAYEEARTHARHAEMVRSNAINYVLVLTSALIVIITLDKDIKRDDLWLCLTMLFLGLFATLFSASYVERYTRNASRATYLRNELDRLFFNPQIAQHTILAICRAADDDPRKLKTLIWARKLSGSTHIFWLGLPTLVFIVGFILTIVSLLAAG